MQSAELGLMKLWKFDSGIYPVIPGMDIALGDYGYWKDSQWCRIGNIGEIQGYPNVLSILTDSLNQHVTESLLVDFVGTANANADADAALKAGTELIFKKKNSQMFIGDLKEYKCYSSINMEIKPLLEKLAECGIWEDEYWLAYYVVRSDNFISIRSKEAGVSIKIDADLDLTSLNQVKAGLKVQLDRNSRSIETVANKDGLSFAGAKFISLDKKGLFRRTVKVKYNSADPEEVLLS